MEKEAGAQNRHAAPPRAPSQCQDQVGLGRAVQQDSCPGLDAGVTASPSLPTSEPGSAR